jgi:hypothetical protein
LKKSSKIPEPKTLETRVFFPRFEEPEVITLRLLKFFVCKRTLTAIRGFALKRFHYDLTANNPIVDLECKMICSRQSEKEGWRIPEC